MTRAGRELWGTHGYAAVSTPEIVKAAGVTRGAMYHQFADKADLFTAVIELVEEDVMNRLVEHVAPTVAPSPGQALRAAADKWLEIATEPEIRQLILLDAPSVLGWDGFRDVAQRYTLGTTEQLLSAAMDAGQLTRQPVRALAHILIGALDEAAMVVATTEDREQAYQEVREVLGHLLDALIVES